MDEVIDVEVARPGGGDERPAVNQPPAAEPTDDGAEPAASDEPVDAPCTGAGGPPPPGVNPTDPQPNAETILWYIQSSCGDRYLIAADVDPVRDLVPDLYDRASAALPRPEPTFLPLDPEFGWTYVKVGTDVRISSSLEPVSVTATASAGAVTIWATVTATPTTVTFDPGEPGAVPISCSPTDVQAGYDPRQPGRCAYEYQNTSAVSANGRTFTTTTSIEWDVVYTSSSGGGSQPSITTTTTGELAVAEYQALVTCTGPRPEQGGC